MDLIVVIENIKIYHLFGLCQIFQVWHIPLTPPPLFKWFSRSGHSDYLMDYTSCPCCTHVLVLVLVHEVSNTSFWSVPKQRSVQCLSMVHPWSHWQNKPDFRIEACLGTVWMASVTVSLFMVPGWRLSFGLYLTLLWCQMTRFKCKHA